MLQVHLPRFAEQIQRAPKLEWDRDKIMDALRGEGDLKRDVLRLVEDRLSQEDPRWTDMLRCGVPDSFFDYMNRVLIEAGQQMFRPGRPPQQRGDAELRRDLLRRRAALREALAGVATGTTAPVGTHCSPPCPLGHRGAEGTDRRGQRIGG
eukprot:3999284-Pyramimonas_sp.AAC.1